MARILDTQGDSTAAEQERQRITEIREKLRQASDVDLIAQQEMAEQTARRQELGLFVSAPQAKATPTGDNAITIVSGLPRSGTSMMMQMLVAGGLSIFTDGNRAADENNPKGYFEADLVKGLAKKNKWLHECDGQVVKVVAPVVPFLPQNVNYKVIYMRRPISEVVRSQSRMLERLGEEKAKVDDERMEKIMRGQSHSAVSLLSLHENPLLRLAYADVIADPLATAAAINDFLGMELEIQC